MSGVVRRKDVLERFAIDLTNQAPIHAIESRSGMDRIDGVPDISRPITVTVESVLLPRSRHELCDPLRTRRADRRWIPSALRRDLGRKHPRRNLRTALGRIADDHGVSGGDHDCSSEAT